MEGVSPLPRTALRSRGWASTISRAFKDDLLLISEGQSEEAFFLAPQAISAIGSAGESRDRFGMQER
jgi:hypothetical protein